MYFSGFLKIIFLPFTNQNIVHTSFHGNDILRLIIGNTQCTSFGNCSYLLKHSQLQGVQRILCQVLLIMANNDSNRFSASLSCICTSVKISSSSSNKVFGNAEFIIIIILKLLSGRGSTILFKKTSHIFRMKDFLPG